jgi:hypothetical protein
MLEWFFTCIGIDITTCNQNITIYVQVFKVSPNPCSQHRLTYFQKLGNENSGTINALFMVPKFHLFISHGEWDNYMCNFSWPISSHLKMMATCAEVHDFMGLYVLRLKRVLEMGMSTLVIALKQDWEGFVWSLSKLMVSLDSSYERCLIIPLLGLEMTIFLIRNR